ncbi:MAG: tetratricopeptide repeat protein [Bacteroidota bacterium]
MSARLAQLKALMAESPNDSFLWFAIAKEYEKQGKITDALEFYQKLTVDAPDDVGTYYHLGKLYEKNSDFESAFKTYKTGIAIATKIGDQHAKGELMAAKLNLGDDDDFE